MSNASKEFKLQIYTPDRVFYDDNAERLIVKTVRGDMGVMYDTMPIVTALVLGDARMFVKGKWMDMTIASGFMEIRDNHVSVFTQNCAWGHEELKEFSEIDDAKEVDKKRASLREHQMAKAQLAIKLARLQKPDNNKF